MLVAAFDSPRFRSSHTALFFTAILLLGGCATGGGPAGPVVSPTGFVYPIGVPPVETRQSQTGILYLRRDNPERTLDLALDGIRTDSLNAIHYYLAGVAYARLGTLKEAGSMFDRAERIYPAYELEVEPERAAAWARALNEGLEAFNLGELDNATEAWQQAAQIYDLRPEAHRNLAILCAGEGLYPEAIELYHQSLSLKPDDTFTCEMLTEALKDALEEPADPTAQIVRAHV